MATQMDTNKILSMVKARLGITATVRDEYLNAIIDSVVKELEDKKKCLRHISSPSPSILRELGCSFFLLFVL
jgi:hypothetical protein